MEYLENLKTFHFKIKPSIGNFYKFEDFSAGLKEKQNLRDLSLEVSNFENNFVGISDCFKNLKNLKKLNLALTGYISRKILEKISKAIIKIRNLECLSI